MELLQLALDASPRAYADSGRLASLADLLGVAERHAELQMAQAAAALAAGDVPAAQEHATSLASQGYAPASGIAAQASAWRHHCA
jgi:hypothetical protein